ncbi:MAG: Druantia anti-phage system protein DruA [Gammaproteobacteria bacterium]
MGLRPVTSRADSRLWNGLIATFHYRGYAVFCGARMRYLITSGHGILGVMGFSAAALTVRDRDRWIGWNREQRRANRHRIVNHSRFLILPWVRVPHLASHLLGLAARRVAADFQARYGYTPLLLEIFVEEGRFAGTCYLAANCGAGLGRPRGVAEATAAPGNNSNSKQRRYPSNRSGFILCVRTGAPVCAPWTGRRAHESHRLHSSHR